MPIYEYRCDACGNEHEAIRKFSEAPLTTCPACGKEALVKKVSAAGFQLKGSGWYQTDFRGGNKPAAAAKTEGDGATTTPAADAKSTDAAPAAKAEPATTKADTKSAPSGGTAAAS